MGYVDSLTVRMCEKFDGLMAENKRFALDFSKLLLQVQQIFLQVEGIPRDGCKVGAGNYPTGN